MPPNSLPLLKCSGLDAAHLKVLRVISKYVIFDKWARSGKKKPRSWFCLVFNESRSFVIFFFFSSIGHNTSVNCQVHTVEGEKYKAWFPKKVTWPSSFWKVSLVIYDLRKKNDFNIKLYCKVKEFSVGLSRIMLVFTTTSTLQLI